MGAPQRRARKAARTSFSGGCSRTGAAYGNLSGNVGYHPIYATGDTPYTSPVGSFAANGYGLYDMAGNMWERCWDWYGSYTAASLTDPRGATSGDVRVIRGGSWAFYVYSCRVADRYFYDLASTSNRFGFRVARTSVP
ncbi:MAG: SUMF1/EgtB/PvdO family nonheme iron enzyme [Verrucomicrobia bacterium]|nr:SUMF1/EgtB/PvdO family nonheme iron enzyme [Verrucomicrobiota bacterium]